MNAREEFLDWVDTRLREAEIAIHNGDAAPRLAIWSSRDPVTLFGAWSSAIGQQEIGDLFRRLENGFSDCTSYEHEVITAEVHGDLAYTVGYEYSEVSFDGVPGRHALRVTQVYRREDGAWKVVHRHADRLAQ